ncbi:hypothetical protein PV396_28080 [Streptomyces sp. ME02-8801-2C]|nr:hypothetical protein [Streptomyces sp. ME02-8801-2C]MDX3455751.1 hypothetical protein [Streptomyces sp. ME02-8801-2C]
MSTLPVPAPSVGLVDAEYGSELVLRLVDPACVRTSRIDSTGS